MTGKADIHTALETAITQCLEPCSIINCNTPTLLAKIEVGHALVKAIEAIVDPIIDVLETTRSERDAEMALHHRFRSELEWLQRRVYEQA